MEPARPFLDVFILGLLVVMWASGMPSWMPGVAVLEPWTQRVTVYTQTQQPAWQLFAPEPKSFCLWVEARVTWSDGRVDVVRTPDWRHQSLSAKLMGARWPKFVDALRRNESVALQESYAHWVVRQLVPREGVEPVTVDLIRHWWNVPPPDELDAARAKFGELPPPQEAFPGRAHFAHFELGP